MDDDIRDATDYLTETLQTEPATQVEIFDQMLTELEAIGKCRAVYHRLAWVLFVKEE